MILEKEETQLEALRNALIAGEQNGRADYALNELMNELNAE